MAATRVSKWSGHTGPVYCLSSDGPSPDHFLSGSGDGLVVRWPLKGPADGIPLARVGRAIFSLLRQGDHLWIGDEDGALHVVDLVHGTEVLFTKAHGKGIFRSLQLPGGSMAVAGGDGRLSIWSTERLNEAPLRVVPVCEGKIRDLALAPDGTALVVACGDGTIRWLSLPHLNEVRTLDAHPAGVTALAFHPAKPVLMSGGKDGVLRIWTAQQDTPLVELKAHTGALYAIAPEAHGRWLATVGRDRNIKLWRGDTLAPLAKLERSVQGHTHSVNTAMVIGDRLVTGSDDRSVLGWTITDDGSAG